MKFSRDGLDQTRQNLVYIVKNRQRTALLNDWNFITIFITLTNKDFCLT